MKLGTISSLLVEAGTQHTVVAALPAYPVIFRKDEDGDIVAFFPATLGDEGPGRMDCYAHVGQHSIATKLYYNSTVAAKPSEYADLLKELRGIYDDYRLEVLEKFPSQAAIDKYNKNLKAVEGAIHFKTAAERAQQRKDAKKYRMAHKAELKRYRAKYAKRMATHKPNAKRSALMHKVAQHYS